MEFLCAAENVEQRGFCGKQNRRFAMESGIDYDPGVQRLATPPRNQKQGHKQMFLHHRPGWQYSR